ncbi:MAG: serine--tRNA ligase [Proteobacteria bacterium]|nr:serine--tRNA ligase [Pseudomonadota bacterium]
MLDLKFVRERLDQVQDMLNKRNSDLDLSEFRRLDEERRRFLGEVEALKAQRNQTNQRITEMKKAGQDASPLIDEIKSVSVRIKELDPLTAQSIESVQNFLLEIPNLPHASVPEGRSEEDNPEIKAWGDPPRFDFEPLNHWDIGEGLDILDFPRAAKITGSRFVLLKGAGSRLERALINYMLDLHTTRHGYTEVLPPFMANAESMTGTGQLPKFGEDAFKLEGWNYYLVPTAEVPVTNMHRDEILDDADLPLCYTAYTPCFRSEAGSHGKDTRGLIRQHQFDKVELVKFTRPEDAWDELEKLLADAESVLQGLSLPYRVVTLCTGDLGFSAAKTYDIEVWLPGQKRYREISSCSCFTDFQARRANIRFRRQAGGKPEFVYTLNGSGLAVGRTLAAILENYQQSDGSVAVPEALGPYMGGLTRITGRG